MLQLTEQCISLSASNVTQALRISREFPGIADVFGTVGFGAAVAADNGRLVTEAFDAIIVFFGLKGTHMHFVLFDITSHDVLLDF